MERWEYCPHYGEMVKDENGCWVSLADAQAEIARLRGAFSNLLEMVEQHADFANGVTDPTGTIDEGRVIAAEQLRKFQEVLK